MKSFVTCIYKKGEGGKERYKQGIPPSRLQKATITASGKGQERSLWPEFLMALLVSFKNNRNGNPTKCI